MIIHRPGPIPEEDHHQFQLNKADRHQLTGIQIVIRFLQEKVYNALPVSLQDRAAKEDHHLHSAGVLRRAAADIPQCHLPVALQDHLVPPVHQDHQAEDHHPVEGDKELIFNKSKLAVHSFDGVVECF
mgnify:FL=1